MPKQIELDPKIELEIIDAYQTQGNNDAICAKYGIHGRVLYRILAKHNIPNNYGRELYLKRIQRLTPEQEQEVIRLHTSGTPASTLSKTYGCSDWVIRNTLKKHGLKPHPCGHARKGKYKYFEEAVQQQILHLRNDLGYSQQAIGEIIGSGQSTVSRFLRSMGEEPVKKQSRQLGGGRIRVDGGYIRVSKKFADEAYYVMADHSGYILEHRLVMAQSLGRPLESHETVHHINGDPADNRLENLQLRQGKHGKGIILKCQDCGSHNVKEVPLD